MGNRRVQLQVYIITFFVCNVLQASHPNTIICSLTQLLSTFREHRFGNVWSCQVTSVEIEQGFNLGTPKRRAHDNLQMQRGLGAESVATATASDCQVLPVGHRLRHHLL